MVYVVVIMMMMVMVVEVMAMVVVLVVVVLVLAGAGTGTDDAGQTPSVTAICGRKPTNRMLEMRSEGDDGGRFVTHSRNQH